MKIGILSDIHGNYMALQAVLTECEKIGVEDIVVLGDFVGYYYEADKVLEAILPWVTYAVAGNHEIMMKELIDGTRDLSEYESFYGSGLSVSLKSMSSEHVEYLLNLPVNTQVVIGGRIFHLCHGSPQDINQYVYPTSSTELLKSCQIDGSDYILLGHTHYPMMVKCGKSFLLNPGSVGQARDLGGLASWMLFDDHNQVFSPRRTPYPASDLIREIKERDPHVPRLWQILLRGQPDITNDMHRESGI